MIAFTIEGAPVPKGRPIFSVVKMGRGPDAKHRVHVNTPQDTIDAERALRLQAIKHRPRKPLDGPLLVDTVFVVTPPARLDADRSRLWPHVKPDDDNYRKLVLDAFNGLFWHDDGQICGGRSFKVYGHPARTVVRIRPLTLEDYEQLADEIGETVAQRGIFGGEK